MAAIDHNKFWSNVAVRGPDECWEWLGIKQNGPGTYGRFGVTGGYVYAHRYSFMIQNGEIGSGLHICHRCDNPGCVNPNHLFAGTARDNVADMIRKGRLHRNRGSKSGRAKMDEAAVTTLRRMAASGKHSFRQIIKIAQSRFDISDHSVRFAIVGKTWRHVPMPPGLKEIAEEKRIIGIPKLTADQAKNIRYQCFSKEKSKAELAEEYGLSVAHIRDIVHYRSWKRAGGPRSVPMKNQFG